MNAPNVTYIWSDLAQEFNCSWHRCIVPYKALLRAGQSTQLVYVTEFTQRSQEAQTACQQADLIIFQRNVFGSAINEIMRWKSLGKAVAIDVDDGYHHMNRETGSKSASFWLDGIGTQNGEPIKLPIPPLDSLEIGVVLAGALTAPSKLLCQDWQKFAQTYYVPNYIDPAIYIRHPVYKQPGRIYIGWGGSMGHLQAWKQSNISQALNRICRTYPQVIVAIAGDTQALSYIDIPDGRKLRLPWQPLSLWSKSLSHFDIGLIPIAGEYDRRRSALKSIEYTLMGIPWIGSNLEPNWEMSQGDNLVENTVDDWYQAIKLRIDHLNDYRQAAALHVDLGMSYDVNRNLDNLTDTYTRIINEQEPA